MKPENVISIVGVALALAFGFWIAFRAPCWLFSAGPIGSVPARCVREVLK